MQKPTVDTYMAINKHDYVPFVFRVVPGVNYIQNVSLSDNVVYTNSPVFIESDVTSSLPRHGVYIQGGRKYVK